MESVVKDKLNSNEPKFVECEPVDRYVILSVLAFHVPQHQIMLQHGIL